MPPQLSPGALQMVLPFLEKLALSPKAEQPVELVRRMSQMVEPSAGFAPSPLRRLAAMLPREGGMVNPDLAMYPERGKFSFAFKPQGTQGDMIGSLGPGDSPKDAYLQYLGSSNSRRLGTGDVSQPMQDYRFDIRSPAQPEFQGRGFQPPPSKQDRAARSFEDRAPRAEAEGSGLPLPSMKQKKLATDRFMDLLRKAGFEGLTFSAEAGERPALYEKLSGYKAQPIGETTLPAMMGRLVGRQGQSGNGMAPTARPTNPLEHAINSSGMSPQFAENILGLSVDEALDYGLLRRAGSSFQLTDQGRRSAQEFLGGQGRL